MRGLDTILRYLPVGLVPLAWSFVALTLFSPVVGDRALRIGLGVMCVLFAVFVVQPGMRDGVLRTWRLVLVGGLATTVVDLALLLAASTSPLLGVSLYAWLVLPALALVATGRAMPDGRWYVVCAALNALGVVLVAAWGLGSLTPAVALAGLAVAALGQAASVALAAVANARSTAG